MRKFLMVAAVCVAACGAYAQKVGIEATMKAQGTAACVSNFTALADTPTNYVLLTGMFVQVPANATGTVSVGAQFLGTNVVIDSFTCYNVRSYPVRQFYMPRKPLTSTAAPEVDRIPWYGTNVMVGIVQTGAATNDWPMLFLLEK